MKRNFRKIVAAFFLFAAMTTCACAQTNAATKVLFVGNSKTIKSNLMPYFKGVCSARGISVTYDRAAKGGRTIKENYLRETADRKCVFNNYYDVLIIQEDNNAYDSIFTKNESVEYTKRIVSLLRRRNPRIRVFVRQAWQTVNDTAADRNEAYARAVASRNAVGGDSHVVMDGRMMRLAEGRFPRWKLYYDDRHQTYFGAYMLADLLAMRVFGDVRAERRFYPPELTRNECRKAQEFVNWYRSAYR